MSLRLVMSVSAAFLMLHSCREEASHPETKGIDSSLVTPTFIASDKQVSVFLDSLQAAAAPLTDTLVARFEAIRAIPDSLIRDQLLDSMQTNRPSERVAPLDNLLGDSVFQSRRLRSATGQTDSSLDRKVRKILADAGYALNGDRYLEYDIWTRKDLITPIASGAQADKMSLQHEEISLGKPSGNDIDKYLSEICDALMRRDEILKKHPNTPQADWAENEAHDEFQMLFVGSMSYHAFQANGTMRDDHLESIRYLGGHSNGPVGQLARDWLALLKANRRKATPEVEAWLQSRRFEIYGTLPESINMGE